jgi:hypothetical protein
MTVGTNIYPQQLVKVVKLFNDHDDVIKIDWSMLMVNENE